MPLCPPSSGFHPIEFRSFILGLESRVIFECLETCSHQWQVLSPLTVFGNTSMSLDRWILSSVWCQHIYSHLLVCTLVLWFPFSLLVGDLTSVNGIHQWSVIILWTTMFNLDTSIQIVRHVLVVVCAHLVRVLPHYTTLLSTSCCMMRDASMPSFQRISSHRIQIIYSGV